MEFQHKELAAGRWAEMTFAQQMLNIGSEISRANRWRTKGNQEQCQRAVYRALELLYLTIAAQQGRHSLKELTRLYEIICDYYLGDNEYQTNPVLLQRTFDMFAC